jgi:hypothetical protein
VTDTQFAMLQKLTLDILGKMAFMFVEPTEAQSQLEGQLAAYIEWQGPDGTDTLILEASSDFLMELASGVLGLEPSEVDTNVEGLLSLKEIANVLAGEIIRELGGEHSHFTLGIPFAIENHGAVDVEDGVVCNFVAMGQGFRASIIHQSVV